MPSNQTNDLELPAPVHALIALLTGVFCGEAVIARDAVANTIERLAAKLRGELITEGQPMNMAILAERVGAKLVWIGALPSAYRDRDGESIGPNHWVSIVDGRPLAVVAGDGGGEGEGATFLRGYLTELGLAEAIGVELLTRCGIPLERAAHHDLAEVGRRLVGAILIPREEVERLFPEDFRATCTEDDSVNERACELAERFSVTLDTALNRVCFLLEDVRPSWCSMNRYHISSRITGVVFGEYEGEVVADAIEAYARDAGYRSICELCATLGQDEETGLAELHVVEVVR